MTPIILAISDAEDSILPIASTAWRTTRPERSALSFVLRTSCPASCARWLESEPVVVISSSAAAVSSTDAACCSVRRDKSSEADRISWDAAAMALAFSDTASIAEQSFDAATLKSVRSFSSAGKNGVESCCVRSPSATLWSAAASKSTLSTRAVTSVANLTTLKTLPFMSKIGL